MASKSISMHYRGMCENQMGMKLEARNSIEAALILGTEKKQAYLDLGGITREIGDWHASLKYNALYESVTGVAPNSATATMFQLIGLHKVTSLLLQFLWLLLVLLL